MSLLPGRLATHQLTHSGLVLAPRRSGRGVRRAITWLAVIAATAGAGYLVGRQQPHDLQRLNAALHDTQLLQQGLEQTRSMLRISDARSKELERQVDALNQRLRECGDELTFFRKARDGKK
jgi:uncharacterized protein HemX